MEIIEGAGADYVEHLRRPGLSVGTYSLRPGAVDTLSPHTEDELHVVTSGRGQFTARRGRLRRRYRRRASGVPVNPLAIF